MRQSERDGIDTAFMKKSRKTDFKLGIDRAVNSGKEGKDDS